MKIIEKRGTGIPRIIKSCKEFGIREPEFIEMGMDIRVKSKIATNFRRWATERYKYCKELP